MFRKTIYVLATLVLGSLLVFIVTGVRRDVSLHTDFWWLVAETALAAFTMILMAIDCERSWKKQFQQP